MTFQNSREKYPGESLASTDTLRAEGDGDFEKNESEEEGTAGILQCVYNMSKTIIGAGIFGLPKVFSDNGFGFSICLLVIVAVIIDWTIMTLITSGTMAGVTTYRALVRRAFGPIGMWIYALGSFFFAFGTMLAYVVVLGDTLPVIVQALAGYSNEEEAMGAPLVVRVFMDRRVMITLTSFFILLPTSLPKRIAKLAITSLIGLLSIFFIVCVVVIQGNLLPIELKGPRDSMDTFIKPAGIFSAIGTMSFAYVCHHNQLVIYRSLRKRSLERYAIVNHLSIGSALTMSLLIGIGGYLAFTSTAQGNVIKNFPLDLPLANVARAAFALDMVFTYPLELFIAREVGTKMIHGPNVSTFVHVVWTIGLVCATTALAVITCDFSFVLDLTGGIAASIIAYIFPSACYLKLAGGPFTLRKIPHILVVLFGFAVMVLTTYMAIKELLAPKSDTKCSYTTLQ